MRVSARRLLALALILGALLPMAKLQPVFAQDEHLGYLWKAEWNFEKSFDGVLIIEVGPWKNGDLLSVEETSTTTIHCEPVGSVHLDGGDAVFKGGHLQCDMNLAETVLNNHQLQIGEVDSYGSIVLRARVNSAANTVVPIFSHQDAAYSLDFTQTFAAKMNQELWNGAGLLQATFPGVLINAWETYGYEYSCNANGSACSAAFSAGPQIQSMPTAGSRVQFSTGPTTFEIGRDGGATFEGRIAGLIVDPGNSKN
jgi:hypothetical protein